MSLGRVKHSFFCIMLAGLKQESLQWQLARVVVGKLCNPLLFHVHFTKEKAETPLIPPPPFPKPTLD